MYQFNVKYVIRAEQPDGTLKDARDGTVGVIAATEEAARKDAGEVVSSMTGENERFEIIGVEQVAEYKGEGEE